MMVAIVYMGCHVLIRRMLFIILVLPLIYPASLNASALESDYHNGVCEPVVLKKEKGIVTSPNYPSVYPERISCMWIIQSKPQTVVTIRVSDLDIEEDSDCQQESCCGHAWLSLPQNGGMGPRKLCGHNVKPETITVSQYLTYIKFHTSKVIKGGRGFNLTYTIDELNEQTQLALCLGFGEVPCDEHASDCYNNGTQRCNGIKDCASGMDEFNCCEPDQYSCITGSGCYTHQQKCDGKPDCHDYSDEIDCDAYCRKGEALCSASLPRCFNPRLERCDGKFDCPFGDDEVNCHPGCHGIVCANGIGCYSPSQRCNYIRNCHDDSDEAGCPRELCILMQGKFQCDNGRCIPEREWCNGIDNCLDNSDEMNCIKNSVITAAIMGSLICGLLLVIAVGCMCRLYSLRLSVTNSYQVHQNVPHSRIRTSAPHPDEEFLNREPPPAYSVAVNDCQQLQRIPSQANNSRVFTVTASDLNSNQRHNSRRSSRRHASNRRRSQRSLTGRNSPLSDPSIFGVGQSRQRISSYPTLSAPCVSVSSTLETPLAAQRESMIVSSHSADNKPVNTDHNSISSISTISVGRRSSADTCILVNPEGEVSPSASSSVSPSRESMTSSTSLLSYLSGNDDDTQLLVLPSS